MAFDTYIRTTSANDLYDAVHSSYYTEQEFNTKFRTISKDNLDLSIFHLNIRNLNANGSNLMQLLSMLDLKFDVIALSEVWSTNITFFKNIFENYTFIYDVPQDSKVGGIGMYVANDLKHRIIPESKLIGNEKCQIENVWVEITKKNKTYIIGGIYRHPDQNITEFKNILDVSVHKMQDKKCTYFIIGDLNIDLLKYANHSIHV